MSASSLTARLLSFVLCILSLNTCKGVASSIQPKGQAIHIAGHVRDQYTGKAIEAARIRVLPSTDDAAWRTDSKGRFSFWIPKHDLGRIEIEAERYGTLSLLPTTDALHDVRLVPESGNSSTALRLSGANAFAVIPASQGVAPAIMTADSGPRPSGTGSNWSPWYRLAIPKAPTGYSVSRIEFWLSGDGACGRSAECRQLTGDDEHVLWEFRLHGHTEIGAPAQTFSVAHIRVMFRPK